MRAYEFITEYVNYDNSKFLARWQQEGKQYQDKIGSNGENFIAWLESFDPSSSKKYVNWMIQKYLKGAIGNLGEIENVLKPILELHHKMVTTKDGKEQLGKYSDFNQFKDINQAKSVMDEFQNVEVKSKKEKKSDFEQQLYKNKQAKLLMNTPEYKVVVTSEYIANCYFGVDTKWCTASEKSSGSFDDYKSRGELHVIIHKPTGKKWQFHFEDQEYMDQLDNNIDLVEFSNTHKEVIKLFSKLRKPLPWYYLIGKIPNELIPSEYLESLDKIGEEMEGGTYIGINNGYHYIVSPVESEKMLPYGLRNISTKHTDMSDGYENTKKLVALASKAEPNNKPEAALYCDSLVINGYDDWFLPSKDELGLMYNANRHFEYNKNEHYWSSSADIDSDDLVYVQHLEYGYDSDGKNNKFLCRAVRRFKV